MRQGKKAVHLGVGFYLTFVCRMMSTWLYQFWFFSFKTAKYWNRGPRFWNADRLRFMDHQLINLPSLPATPDMGMWDPTSLAMANDTSSSNVGAAETRAISEPSP